MDKVVYEGLVRVVGRRKIIAFLMGLESPHVIDKDLADGYQAMGLDVTREQEAFEWSEAIILASDGASYVQHRQTLPQ